MRSHVETDAQADQEPEAWAVSPALDHANRDDRDADLDGQLSLGEPEPLAVMPHVGTKPQEGFTLPFLYLVRGGHEAPLPRSGCQNTGS